MTSSVMTFEDELVFDMNLEEDVAAELEDFVFTARLGLIEEAQVAIDHILCRHLNIFAVTAEVCSFLIEQEACDQVDQILQKLEEDGIMFTAPQEKEFIRTIYEVNLELRYPNRQPKRWDISHVLAGDDFDDPVKVHRAELIWLASLERAADQHGVILYFLIDHFRNLLDRKLNAEATRIFVIACQAAAPREHYLLQSYVSVLYTELMGYLQGSEYTQGQNRSKAEIDCLLCLLSAKSEMVKFLTHFPQHKYPLQTVHEELGEVLQILFRDTSLPPSRSAFAQTWREFDPSLSRLVEGHQSTTFGLQNFIPEQETMLHDTLMNMDNLAVVLWNQGKYEEAEHMHREVLGVRQKVLGTEHPSTLASMNNLAVVLSDQGKYEDAEQMHREVIGVTQKVLGMEHPDTLTSMNNLAGVLRDQGKYKEADHMHREVIGVRQKVLGMEHPSTLTSMNNRALVLSDQGKYGDAEHMHREVLRAKQKVLGMEHPSTLASMNNLAVVLSDQGKYEDAEHMHREGLGLTQKVLGMEHPSTLTSMNNLALVLRDQGKYEDAEHMHREAIGVREKVLGTEHPDTLTSMSNLAVVLRNQGKYEEAEHMHREVIGVRQEVLGMEHPDTLTSMNNLAVVLRNQGKYQEAEHMHREVIGVRQKVLGMGHPDTLTSTKNLALVLRDQGKYEDAEHMHREMIGVRQKVLGMEHPRH